MDDVLRLAHWAEQRAHEPALLAPGSGPISYGALRVLLHDARSALKFHGLGPREVAAVTMRPGLDSFLAFLAVAEDSACAPIDPSLTSDELKRDLARIGAGTLIVQDAGESPALAAARELGLRVLRLARFRSGALAVEAVLPRVSKLAPRYTDAAFLNLTSSTTGNPKLVPTTAADLGLRLPREGRAYGLSSADRCLITLPLFHLHGIFTSLRQLSFGGALVLAPRFDSARFASWWQEFRPTWFSASVPMLHAIAAASPADREIFAAAPPRFVRSAGSTPGEALCEAVEKIMRAPVLVAYGSSEAGTVSCNRIGASRPGSVGTSLGLTIAVSPEGEVLLQGEGLMPAYCDDEEATRQAFRNGWFHTGDVGHLDADGFLYLTGRLKEIINRGSQKILPGEIDQVLAGHSAVKDAAAFGVPHRTLGEEVAAAVVLHDGAGLSAPDLRRYAAGRLARFKIPRLIVFVDQIPCTPAGKPKRAALAAHYGTDAAHQSAAERPANDVERGIMRIWSRILNHPVATIQDDFMLLGGDSLSAAGMLVAVDAEFHTGGRLLGRADFFDEPTVESLARIVLECQPFSADAEPAPDGILALARGGDGVPLFCFPGWRGRDGGAVDRYYMRHFAASLGDRRPFYFVTASLPPKGAPAGSVEEVASKCVEAIRGVQRHGPYLFGGHCLGAVVAFETARQLVSQGEQVLPLLLFDAEAPGYPKLATNGGKYVAELSRMVRDLDGRAAWSHLYSSARLLHALIAGKLRRVGAALGLESLNATLLNSRRGAALWQYVPRECPVPMVHFMAADQPVSQVLDDPRYGWQDLARAGIEFRTVPGDHHSMFSAENSPSLAAQVRAHLESPVLAPSRDD